MQPNIPHVTDIENAHTRTHRVVLGNNPARRRVFHRHVPAIELHHLRAHLAMDGVQCRLADYRPGGFSGGQFLLNQKAVAWAAGMARLITLTCWRRRRQPRPRRAPKSSYQRHFPSIRPGATVPLWPPVAPPKTSIAACSAR